MKKADSRVDPFIQREQKTRSLSTSLPSGTVTFLFTDIEGSVPLWEKMPREMQAAVQQHHSLFCQAIETNRGHVFQITGDAFQAAFRLADEALKAAIDAQLSLQSANWGATGALHVRMGLHTGSAEIDPIPGPDGVAQYAVNHTLNRAARVMSTAHGGQILLSQEVADLVIRCLPNGVSLTDLGEHRLKGMQLPEHLYQVLAPGLQQQFPPLSSSITYPNNLPVQLTSFIGREKEISEIRQALNTHRLVTLTGSGGTGKTRLALRVAEMELEHYLDGVWFIELSSITNPDLIPITLLAVFGLGEQPGRSALQLLQDYLRQKTLLFVLDNCEHLIEPSAQVANTLLKAAPQIRLLVTSREALGVSGELAWHVPSLSLPDTKKMPEIEKIIQYEAVRLFIERARLVQPKFELNPTNAQAVVQVCSRLDGIPLAIELAAARVKLLSPEQISARLDDRFRLLSGGSRTALPRQQTLRSLIDWSYDLLTDSERLLFRRLAVFSGGWTLELAEQVCGDELLDGFEILELLGRLVDKSLVVVKQGDTKARYLMLETIRQYAREKLFESGEAAMLRDRHMTCFLELAEKAEPELLGPDQLAWLHLLDAEFENLRAALEWAQNQNAEIFLRLASALWRFWDDQGCALEGSTWLLKALELNQELHSPIRVKALARTSTLLLNPAELDPSFRLAKAAVELGETLQDKPALALAYESLHRSAVFTNQEALKKSSREKGLALSRELNNHWIISRILCDSSWDISDLEQRCAIQEESIQEARLAGDTSVIGLCLANAAQMALLQGDPARAYDYYKEALRLAHHFGVKDAIANRSADMASWAVYVEDYAQAEQLAAEALQICRDIGSPMIIVLRLIGSGFLAWAEGNIDRLSAYTQEADEIASQQEEKGSLAWAIAFFQGEIARMKGKSDKAKACFRDALEMATDRDLFALIFVLGGLACLAADQGQVELAVRMFAVSEKFRILDGVIDYPFQQRMRQQRLDKALALLGRDTYDAIWTQGKAMSPEEAYAYAFLEGD